MIIFNDGDRLKTPNKNIPMKKLKTKPWWKSIYEYCDGKILYYNGFLVISTGRESYKVAALCSAINRTEARDGLTYYFHDVFNSTRESKNFVDSLLKAYRPDKSQQKRRKYVNQRKRPTRWGLHPRG